MDEGADPRSKIRSIIHLSMEFCRLHRDKISIIMDLWAMSIRRTRDPSMPGFTERYMETQQYLAAIIEEGVTAGVFRQVDSVTAGSLLLALLDGLLFQVVLGLVPLEDDSLTTRVSGLFLDGLTTKSPNERETDE